MDEVYIRNVSHLGDVLIILNLIYSQSNKHRVIYGPTFIPEILEIFDYGFEYGGLAPSIPLHFPCQIIKFMPVIRNGVLAGNQAEMLFLGDGGFFKAAWEPIIELKFPQLKLPFPEREDFVAFQFDSRSVINSIGKVALTEELMKLALHEFSDRKPIGLGGKETIPYLGYEFRLGNLREIVINLMKSGQFIGVDSGVSVLAGMLGISGHVILLHTFENYIEEITQFYRIMFPTMKLYRRNLKPIYDQIRFV